MKVRRQPPATGTVKPAALSPLRLLEIMMTVLVRIRSCGYAEYVKAKCRISVTVSGYPPYTTSCWSDTCSNFPIAPPKHHDDCFNTDSGGYTEYFKPKCRISAIWVTLAAFPITPPRNHADCFNTDSDGYSECFKAKCKISTKYRPDARVTQLQLLHAF